MSAAAIVFVIQDRKGKTSTTKLHFPSGFSLAQYADLADAFGQLLASLSNGVITDIGITLPLDFDYSLVKSVIGSAADIAEKVMLTIRSGVAGLFSFMRIPTYDDVFTIAGTDTPNAVDFANLVAIMEDGVDVSGEQVQPQDTRGQDLATVSQMREIFRRT